MTCFFAVLVCVFGTHSHDDTESIPLEFQGIWRVSKVVDSDGTRFERTQESEANFVRKFGSEFLIVGDRFIHVSHDGKTIMCYATVEQSRPDVLLRLSRARAHIDESLEESFAVLRHGGNNVSIYSSYDRMIVGQDDPKDQLMYTVSRASGG